VCADVELRTVQVVKNAYRNMVPWKVGAGRGQENRIMENRRLKLKDGSESDVRHAYSLPRDEDVAGIGPAFMGDMVVKFEDWEKVLRDTVPVKLQARPAPCSAVQPRQTR
jgi:hypothetical protein